MKFSLGIVAMILVNKNPIKACKYSSVVYAYLHDTLGINHDKSFDAMAWCEMASVGDLYSEKDFSIKIIDTSGGLYA